jgi:hypothetical protein
MPATVAAADDSELVLWVAPETPCIYPIGSDADRQVRPPGSWELRERQWYGAGVLHRFREGDAHSLMHIWDDNGRFSAWYVNLQQPFRPSRLGVDTRDHALDIWIDANGSWRWKDEDHLKQFVELGLLSVEEAADVQAEGERVLAEWPFPTGWEDWRADPAWPVAQLPADWHVV